MFANGETLETHSLSEMQTINDDQGSLLNKESTNQDDYILAYRLLIK